MSLVILLYSFPLSSPSPFPTSASCFRRIPALDRGFPCLYHSSKRNGNLDAKSLGNGENTGRQCSIPSRLRQHSGSAAAADPWSSRLRKRSHIDRDTHCFSLIKNRFTGRLPAAHRAAYRKPGGGCPGSIKADLYRPDLIGGIKRITRSLHSAPTQYSGDPH